LNLQMPAKKIYSWNSISLLVLIPQISIV